MDSKQFATFLNGISNNPLYVLDKAIPLSQYTPIDLSETNPELSTFNISNSQAWESYINEHLKNNNANVAFGGYAERRNIYKRSFYFNQENQQLERNIHLGIDLWLKAGSKVFSPLEGQVHSFANNTNYGDYGPTIIIEHHVEDIVFYTLYGHLSEDSIKLLKQGQQIKAGQQIGVLGHSQVNGDYAPHLHFQIIRDLGNYEGDYPGVSSKKDLQYYLNNCPDPNLLLKLS